jgi:hypothetical protein
MIRVKLKKHIIITSNAIDRDKILICFWDMKYVT